MKDTTHSERRFKTINRGWRRWLGLAAGLGTIWVMGYVILPWSQTLGPIRPIMTIITDADIDAGTYWYTQSEETALAQMYVRNVIRKQ